MKSNDSDGVGRSLGKTMAANTIASTPMGRLIRKIHGQLYVSISQPPRMGPEMGPSSIGIPSTAISRPSRLGPASRVRMVNVRGINIPPPSPCMTRNVISVVMLGAIAHNAEPSVKNNTDPMNRRLVPNRSAAQPASGMTVASARV